MKRRGIPTKYADTNFRSRVEARWAAFFDLVGWPWTYEPYDLNGYIPDFSLDFRTPIIVEVKSDGTYTAGAYDKISRSGWEGEAIVLTGVWPHDHWAEMAGGSWCILVYCQSCKRTTIAWGPHECLICGAESLESDPLPPKQDVQLAWRLAGNHVQWRKRA